MPVASAAQGLNQATNPAHAIAPSDAAAGSQSALPKVSGSRKTSFPDLVHLPELPLIRWPRILLLIRRDQASSILLKQTSTPSLIHQIPYPLAPVSFGLSNTLPPPRDLPHTPVSAESVEVPNGRRETHGCQDPKNLLMQLLGSDKTCITASHRQRICNC